MCLCLGINSINPFGVYETWARISCQTTGNGPLLLSCSEVRTLLSLTTSTTMVFSWHRHCNRWLHRPAELENHDNESEWVCGECWDCINSFTIPNDVVLGESDFVRSEGDDEEGFPTKLLNNEPTRRRCSVVQPITGTRVHDFGDKRYFSCTGICVSPGCF
jgi:hypothetical protein